MLALEVSLALTVSGGTALRAAGLRVEYVPQARIRHRSAGSGHSHALVALNAVNRVRYFEKHGKPTSGIRAAVLLHLLLRSASASHRAALLTVSRPSTWEPLISRLKARSVKAAPCLAADESLTEALD